MAESLHVLAGSYFQAVLRRVWFSTCSRTVTFKTKHCLLVTPRHMLWRIVSFEGFFKDPEDVKVSSFKKKNQKM